ncbi:hypothetical protein [Klenkia sp. PcliD-1-E]|uniref:hypothetical protein n=1 Tax=Klenkia sp. PcliD-1-E TaxID=2954492 RepID=UPI002097089B|nr:hypothetical protein [Klenkia sp. PcliD-1-E]MCO7220127.1 hypothetical protein [Klenkia sp. PcliD-1-E]
MSATRWAQLRQVISATSDLEGDSAAARAALGLAPGFPDPVLETVGMADESLPIGAAHEGPAGGGAFLELVGPLREDVPLTRWLTKVGGRGGYGLSIQVDDVAAGVAAATEAGVRVVADQEVYGHRIVQLRPGDLGLLVELDGIADPDVWFWDDVPMTRSSGALVDDVLGVDVGGPDPRARAAVLGAILGVPVTTGEDGCPQLVLAAPGRPGRTVRFTADGSGLCGVELSLRDGATAPAEPLTFGGMPVRFRTV